MNIEINLVAIEASARRAACIEAERQIAQLFKEDTLTDRSGHGFSIIQIALERAIDEKRIDIETIAKDAFEAYLFNNLERIVNEHVEKAIGKIAYYFANKEALALMQNRVRDKIAPIEK